jgi:hypothetical protein
MKISGIDFPEPLLAALRDNRLVIFAGAGVSMGAPASLPSFKRLAGQIALGTGQEMENGEPPDRFLGRLQASGVKVHEVAAERLSDGDPQPNVLHCGLLGCFSNGQAVRVVTTNFDPLFERAAQSSFGSALPSYSAPALPRGGDFDGIVHVHGSLAGVKSMVLTDEDFGRAYLTEGWALRFLLDLFQAFSVLFVGYSHNDVVMSYLARALPTPDLSRPDAARRFALTDQATDRRWGLLGIEPIAYPMSNSGDHSGLGDGIAGLASYVGRDLLGWQRTIADIVQGPPPVDPEQQDLISDVVEDPDRVQFFTKVATDAKWIEWLARRDHLAALFDPSAAADDDGVSSRLAWWLSSRFAREHSDELLRVFGSQRMRPGARLWGALVLTLVAKDEDTGQIPEWKPVVVDKWISVLLGHIPQGAQFVDVRLGNLAEAAAQAGLEDALIDCFDVLAGLSLASRYGVADRAWALNKIWTANLAPRVPLVAERLLRPVLARLEARHRQAGTWENATRESGSAVWRRSRIDEQDGEGRNYDSNDVLIDAARDCLLHLLQHEPQTAAAHLDQMIRSEAPLVRRIAVHSAAMRSDLSADEQAEWLLNEVSLHDRACQRELRLFAQDTFGILSDRSKQRFLLAVDDYPYQAEMQDAQMKVAVADVKMDWLAWLHQVDSDCALAAAAAQRLGQEFPELSIERDLDLDAGRSEVGWVTRESPWTADELLASPAKEWLPQLLEFKGDDPLGPRLGRLLEQVREAAGERFDWGIDLADALDEDGHWDSALWRPLFEAWQLETEEAEFRQVLARLGSTDLQRHHSKALGRVFATLVSGGGRPYATQLLSVANDLASSLWSDLSEDADRAAGLDWYTKAINHAAGPIAEFWLNSLSLALREDAADCERLEEPYRSAFDTMVQDRTHNGRMARAVLCRAFSFLLHVDETWTRERLVPFLTEPPNSDEFQAAWDGLMRASLDLSTVDALTPAFLSAANHVQAFIDSHTRETFTAYLVGWLIDVVDDPIDVWIPSFLVNAADEDRQQFAWEIGRRLGDMSEAETEELWRRWLRRYWGNRVNGVPIPPRPSEMATMLDWLLHLGGLFREAVQLAVQMPHSEVVPFMLIDGLKEGAQCEQEPDSVADLLIWMGKSESGLPPGWEWGGLIERVLEAGVTADRAESLHELRAGLGLS